MFKRFYYATYNRTGCRFSSGSQKHIMPVVFFTKAERDFFVKFNEGKNLSVKRISKRRAVELAKPVKGAADFKAFLVSCELDKIYLTPKGDFMNGEGLLKAVAR